MPDPDACLLTGGCGCGAVRFEVTEPPVGAGYCHCTRCRHRTGGAASLQTRTARGSFRLTAGEADLSVWAPGGGFEKVFCRQCGSALFSRDPDDASIVSVRFGAFDDDPPIRPTYRAFVDFAAAFEPIPDDGLARYGEGRPTLGSRGHALAGERSAPGGEPPTLEFADPWRIAGSTGVNRYFGSYELPGDEIVFGLVGSTLMAGPEPAMRVERQFLAVLSGTQPVEIADGALRIGTGAEALRLTALD